MRRIISSTISVCVCLALLGCDTQTEAPPAQSSLGSGFDGLGTVLVPVAESPRGPTRLVYVPVYSRLFLTRQTYWELSSSLSIRNTDTDQPIIIHEVGYFDTAGELLQQFLDGPHELSPLATVTLTLPQSDSRGGAGANYLVRWSGGDEIADDVNEPIIEVISAGIQGTQSFSFIRTGQEIRE